MSPGNVAAELFGRVARIRRGTWIAIGLGVLTLFALLIWAAVSLFGWLWGQGKTLAQDMPEAARIVAAQVERSLPGAREAVGDLLPALKSEAPPRDVSGSDIGPVARYPGLVREYWRNEGGEITVRYAGRADYAAVLDHYAQGFAAHGYAQSVIAAAPESEEHLYAGNGEQLRFRLVRLPQGRIEATLIAVRP